ncbi:large ribosomal subunit protein uL23c-like [Silene latifolia]|uniref:large ribosomal subunit protein uL23c-like n=1 Tax=Silene latifolia TaxID=37657 RepID=UPI003D781021
MATALPNLHSFSSSSSSSFTFQIPHFPKAATVFLHPLHNVPTYLSASTDNTFNFHGKPCLGRSQTFVQATEVLAPTSEDPAGSQTKSSKKKKNIKYPRRVLDQYQVLQFPIITEAAVKNIAEENTLLFTVDIRADKQMIKDAVRNLFGVKVRKVNTAIRPDGTKKAHIMLSKEYNASELAKKIGIFPSSD